MLNAFSMCVYFYFYPLFVLCVCKVFRNLFFPCFLLNMFYVVYWKTRKLSNNFIINLLFPSCVLVFFSFYFFSALFSFFSFLHSNLPCSSGLRLRRTVDTVLGSCRTIPTRAWSGGSREVTIP